MRVSRPHPSVNAVPGRAAAAAAMLLLAACGLPSSGASPSPSPSLPASPTSSPPTSPPAGATGSPAPQASGTAAASRSPAAAEDLAWRQAGIFGGDGETSANAVAGSSFGFVAAGTEYDQRLPNLGPTPGHEGRVWISADGASWDEVTPTDTFNNVSLNHVLTTADGALRVVGTVSEPSDFGTLDSTGTGVWESSDGATWNPVASPFPEASIVSDFAQGARGSIAIVTPMGGSSARLWHSADGRAWEGVLDVVGPVDLDAGDEGFVISGERGELDAPDPYVLASSDGREWIEATALPDRAGQVAALGGDWFLITEPPLTGQEEHVDATVWRSANGLEWSQIGSMPRAVLQLEGGRCYEHLAEAVGAGSWVVVNTGVSYPCSEGGFVTHGTQRITSTGTSWFDLPFPSSLPEAGGGSGVRAGAAGEHRLIVVGQADLKASMWVGE